MDTLQIFEIWIRSLRGNFEAAGVEVIYERSPSERPNPSFAITLRRGPVEVDLLVWESGHADLSTMDESGSVTQKHFENLKDVDAAAGVLAVLAGILPTPGNM
jgi:hypothetical protein